MDEYYMNAIDQFFTRMQALEDKVKELEERLAKAEEKNHTLEERVEYHADWLSNLADEKSVS